MKRVAALALAVLTACSGSTPEYGPEDLQNLVLMRAPGGTTRTPGSGSIDLEAVSSGDPDRKKRFRDAGFVAAYEQTYTGEIGSPSAFLLTSRAYLFEDPAAGIAMLRETIDLEGGEVTERGRLFPDRKGFVVVGVPEQNLPPGIVIVWTKHNAILVLAVLTTDDVNERQARTIARRIDDLAPEPA